MRIGFDSQIMLFGLLVGTPQQQPAFQIIRVLFKLFGQTVNHFLKLWGRIGLLMSFRLGAKIRQIEPA